MYEDIKSLKKKAFQSYSFDLWDNMDCDSAHNFRHYFTKFNADRLSYELNYEKAIKKSFHHGFTKMSSRRIKLN